MTVTTSMVLLETLVKMLRRLWCPTVQKGFNAGVYEYIGDFIKPIKPVLYHTQQWIKNRR